MKIIIKKKLIALSIIAVIITSISISSSFFLYNNICSKRNKGNLIPLLSISANTTFGKSPLKIHFESSAVDNDGDIISYFWNFDDGGISNKKNPDYTYSEKGKYLVSLTVEDDEGGTKVDYIEINVIENNPPIAHIHANNIIGRSPLTVEFQGSGKDSDGRIISYYWDFGDKSILMNTTSNNQNESYLYLKSGTYVVNFTVTDDNGAKDTKMIKIEVKPNLLTVCYRIIIYGIWIINKIKNFINNFRGN